jgi:glycosyltransferase involved in cell wall biosynthesis
MHAHHLPAHRPLVTAVIPTRGRPEMVARAVRSALRQTWKQLEVVVVLDGPDPETEACLAALANTRLRTLILPQATGGSAGRNAGVRVACGEWIALLDDDDEWLPHKIELQMRTVRQTSTWFPVLSCRLIEESPSGRRVLPPRIFDGSEPLGDYLFRRRSFLDSGGFLQTSTLLAPRDLLLAIPFREDLPMHQDWDWILQVAAHQGVSIVMLSQPLVVYHTGAAHAAVSRSSDWRFSLQWIREHRQFVSPKAAGAFIAIQCAWRARCARRPLRNLLWVMAAWLRNGGGDRLSFAHLLWFGLLPSSVRRALRDRLGRPAAALGTVPARLQLPGGRSGALRNTNA